MNSVYIALLLIVTGALFLLRNRELLPDPTWGLVWPLVLIVFGGALFFGGHETHGFCWPGCSCADRNSRKRGGVVGILKQSFAHRDGF